MYEKVKAFTIKYKLYILKVSCIVECRVECNNYSEIKFEAEIKR